VRAAHRECSEVIGIQESLRIYTTPVTVQPAVPSVVEVAHDHKHDGISYLTSDDLILMLSCSSYTSARC
jgi:hypothetical protein